MSCINLISSNTQFLFCMSLNLFSCQFCCPTVRENIICLCRLTYRFVYCSIRLIFRVLRIRIFLFLLLIFWNFSVLPSLSAFLMTAFSFPDDSPPRQSLLRQSQALLLLLPDRQQSFYPVFSFFMRNDLFLYRIPIICFIIDNRLFHTCKFFSAQRNRMSVQLKCLADIIIYILRTGYTKAMFNSPFTKCQTNRLHRKCIAAFRALTTLFPCILYRFF